MDYVTKNRRKPLRQGETAVPVTPNRANLILELFDAYYKRVYCFTRKSLAPSAAEDIAQEVFTRLLQVKAQGLEGLCLPLRGPIHAQEALSLPRVKLDGR